jgi:mannose-6-phosphate isomerase-like protein (cupin superfamily)
MTYAPGSIVVKPEQGRRIAVMGNLHLNKVESADTDGAWALLEQEVLGANPPLHLHEREDEAFYVLAGRVRVWVGARSLRAVPAPSSSHLVACPTPTLGSLGRI